MTLIEKIPTLSDEDVINLLANARRLSGSEDEKRRAAAIALIPPLEDAAAERRASRLAVSQARRAARKPRTSAA